MKPAKTIRNILFVITNLFQLIIGFFIVLLAATAVVGIFIGAIILLVVLKEYGLGIFLVITIGIALIFSLIPMLGTGLLFIAPSIPAVIRIASKKERVKAVCAIINAVTMTMVSTYVFLHAVAGTVYGVFNILSNWNTIDYLQSLYIAEGMFIGATIIVFFMLLADVALLVLTCILDKSAIKDKKADSREEFEEGEEAYDVVEENEEAEEFVNVSIGEE